MLAHRGGPEKEALRDGAIALAYGARDPCRKRVGLAPSDTPPSICFPDGCIVVPPIPTRERSSDHRGLSLFEDGTPWRQR